MGQRGRGKTRREQTGQTTHKRKGKLIDVDAPLDELDDDIDKFYKGSDKIPLDVNEDSELSEDQMEEPVFNLKGGESSDDADMESEDEDLDEEQFSGLAAKMAKQAKILRQKTSLMEDEEEEEEEEAERQKKAAWGKRKKMYYSADNVDYELQSTDEEAPAEEEAEALRLQRLKAESLRPEDFELNEDDGVEAPLEAHEQMLQEVVERQEAKGSQDRRHISSKRCRLGDLVEESNIFVEELQKDLNALSKEEQMEVVISDAPELVGLLAELREGVDELQNKIEPLLNKIKGAHIATKEGIRFFETKHMLLLCYCQAIVFYLLLKAEGQSVRDHPVIARLVEIRMLLEKLGPIEQQLHEQIDILMSLMKERPPAHGIKESLNKNDELNHKSAPHLCALNTGQVAAIVPRDTTISVKESLRNKKAKLEMLKVSKVNDETDDKKEHVDAQLEEDEFYQEARQLQAEKQAAKELKYTRNLFPAPIAEEEIGKRHISYQMEKNKGLTPHRKKLTKNPRKKYKLKHQKALIQRKGQVRDVKVPRGSYGGEATGIRTNISRSVRFAG